VASTGETGSDALVRIEPETGQALAPTPLDPDPWYVAAGGGAVWVGFPRSSVIQQVDATTNEVTGRIALPGDGVSAIAADDEAVRVEVFQDRSDQGQQNLASLVRVDPQTSEVVATIPLERSIPRCSHRLHLHGHCFRRGYGRDLDSNDRRAEARRHRLNGNSTTVKSAGTRRGDGSEPVASA
jgi:hypothetical protein